MLDYSEVKYKGLRCIQIIFKEMMLIVSVELGPRILYYGPKDGSFTPIFVADDVAVKDGVWHNRGGSFLWVAPETDNIATYYPDEHEVIVVEQTDHRLHLAAIEPENYLKKHITIEWSVYADYEITYWLENVGNRPFIGAPWAISAVIKNGRGVIPILSRKDQPSYLTPDETFVPWRYFNHNDGRFNWGNRYLMMDYTEGFKSNKFGYFPALWVGHITETHFFVKSVVVVHKDRKYVDRGANAMIYTDGTTPFKHSEIESQGPEDTIMPGESGTLHRERWHLISHNFGNHPTEDQIDDLTARIYHLPIQEK